MPTQAVVQKHSAPHRQVRVPILALVAGLVVVILVPWISIGFLATP